MLRLYSLLFKCACVPPCVCVVVKIKSNQIETRAREFMNEEIYCGKKREKSIEKWANSSRSVIRCMRERIDCVYFSFLFLFPANARLFLIYGNNKIIIKFSNCTIHFGYMFHGHGHGHRSRFNTLTNLCSLEMLKRLPYIISALTKIHLHFHANDYKWCKL